MRLLEPTTPVTLASTNVDTSSLDEWSDASVAYDVGDQVKLTSGQPLPHREYECIQAHTSSATNVPVSGGNAYWADTGPTNQHAMFDERNTSRTVATAVDGSVVVELTITRRLQTLALLGLRNVSSVRIVETVGGVDVADTTHNLMTVFTPVGWWTFYFGERTYARSLVHELYGTASNRTLTITLTGSSGGAGIAQCLPCKAYDLGCTETGAMPRLRSFSTWEPNTYGGYRYVPRKNTREGTYTIWVDTVQFDRVYGLMESLMEKLVLLDANNYNTNYDSIRAFGKITDFSPGLEYNKSAIDIKIEGVD
jgi:hypothetical protein